MYWKNQHLIFPSYQDDMHIKYLYQNPKDKINRANIIKIVHGNKSTTMQITLEKYDKVKNIMFYDLILYKNIKSKLYKLLIK